MIDSGPGVFDQTGDAIIIEQGTPVSHRTMWMPVPATGELVTVPDLEVPADHPGALDLNFRRRGFKLGHDDRLAPQGYAAYVENGVGLVEPLMHPGERLEVSETVGRF